MTLQTWTKESKGLFNLTAPANELSVSHFYLTESRIFLGNPRDGRYYFVNKYADNEFSKDLRKFKLMLGNVNHAENYLSCIGNENSASAKIWIPIQSQELNEFTKIEEGDFVRFGRQVVRIAKIFGIKRNTLRSGNPNLSRADPVQQARRQAEALLSNSNNRSGNQSNIRMSDVVCCRICLEPESTSRPFDKDMCLCSPRMPAHFDCLVKWLNRKCEVAVQGKFSYYDLERLKCDICKISYPPQVKFQGQDVTIIDIKPPANKTGIMLETYKKETGQVSGVFILEFDEKSPVVTVGRTSESDLRFNDASVSRNHSKFVMFNGEFYVLDFGSKFGTCKKAPDNFPLIQAEGRVFLIDKFKLTFHVLRTRKHCDCFKKGYPFLTNPLDNVPLLAIADEDVEIPLRFGDNNESPSLVDPRPILDEIARHRSTLNLNRNSNRVITSRPQIDAIPVNPLRQQSISILEQQLNRPESPIESGSNENPPQLSNSRLIDRVILPDTRRQTNRASNGIIQRNTKSHDLSFEQKILQESLLMSHGPSDFIMQSRPFNLPHIDAGDLDNESAIAPPDLVNIKPSIKKTEKSESKNMTASRTYNINLDTNAKTSAEKENQVTMPVRLSTLKRVSYANMVNHSSAEDLVFSGLTSSNLEFGEMEDYEFN
jgi:hypothetical protein